jgi:hypothetical protein
MKSVVSSGSSSNSRSSNNTAKSPLTCLRNVIQALVNRQANVPFRDSILTCWLQPYLQGEGKCLLFVNICPEREHFKGTNKYLQLASVTKKISDKK